MHLCLFIEYSVTELALIQMCFDTLFKFHAGKNDLHY